MSSQRITYATLVTDEGVHPIYESALERVRSELGRRHPMRIGDEEVYSSEGEFVKASPFDTRIVIGRFQRCSAEHVRESIKTAKRALDGWSRTGWRERLEVAKRVMDIIDREKFELAALITYEVGKNRFEAIAEVYEVIDFFNYYINLLEERRGFETPMKSLLSSEECVSVLRPHGVFFVISPWNFPLMLLNNMTAGAWLMGNAAVMKPSSESPLVALKLYQIYLEAGIPPGVVNIITGPGDVVGGEIVSNRDVDGIAFTGSRDVGMYLYREFVKNQPWPKPIITEMGSKNPVIISERADIDKAVLGVVRAAFGYQGQKCSAASRVYVQEGIAEKFLDRLIEKTSELKVGDPRRRENFIGPLINKAALEKFASSVEIAKKSGGEVIYGGEVLTWGEYKHGYYVEPTIITNLQTDHQLFREELFVPILLVAKYKTLDEAVRLANSTDYGLTAGIFSEDEDEVKYFFENVQFGVCYANRRGGATTGAWPGAQSFGGWKASGSTGKGVGGPYYLLQFAREQSQTIVRE